jgi:hypothetical protein
VLISADAIIECKVMFSRLQHFERAKSGERDDVAGLHVVEHPLGLAGVAANIELRNAVQVRRFIHFSSVLQMGIVCHTYNTLRAKTAVLQNVAKNEDLFEDRQHRQDYE